MLGPEKVPRLQGAIKQTPATDVAITKQVGVRDRTVANWRKRSGVASAATRSNAAEVGKAEGREA